MANGYVSSITLPNNDVLTIKDKNALTQIYITGSSTATASTTVALENGHVYIRTFDSTTAHNTYQISGSGASTVTTDTAGNITVSSTDSKVELVDFMGGS